MGERAHLGYEEAERAAFAALPWRRRLLANLVAIVTVALLAFAFTITFMGPQLANFGAR